MMSAASGTVACSPLNSEVGNPTENTAQQTEADQQTETVGLWPVLVGDRLGYINKEGMIVINPQFDQIRPFSEGLAAVRVGDRWGYIDKEGTMVINPQFDSAEPFSEGLA
ncbi:WG repeat-containing protein, partial [Picosynechococcus sp. NKBG042902]|uniref:WG repeat-containing protein n=1 Tax=Picosynechococcus sp. NKBG042902 TaxID=490193 RepID=UPI001377DD22